jgi:hypothetical protein
MLKLDNNLLDELGLGGLPEEQKRAMLQHIYETLELRVGTDLANQMTDQQLEEFEKFIDEGGDANQSQALQWLERNLPHYKDVVNRVFEELKTEIRNMAPQILASGASQQSAVQQPVSGPGMYAQPQPAPAQYQQPMAGGMPMQPQAAPQPQPMMPAQPAQVPGALYQQPQYASPAPAPMPMGPQPMPVSDPQGQFGQPPSQPGQPQSGQPPMPPAGYPPQQPPAGPGAGGYSPYTDDQAAA